MTDDESDFFPSKPFISKDLVHCSCKCTSFSKPLFQVQILFALQVTTFSIHFASFITIRCYCPYEYLSFASLTLYPLSVVTPTYAPVPSPRLLITCPIPQVTALSPAVSFSTKSHSLASNNAPFPTFSPAHSSNNCHLASRFCTMTCLGGELPPSRGCIERKR